MERFARLGSEERRDYFEAAAAALGNMSAEIVQKDFWVCLTLKELFNLKDIGTHLTFKGGTSLSKVFGIIKRFSEDIDIAIERDFLGFGGNNDPERAASKKKRERRLQGLKVKCQEVIRDQILRALSERFEASLGTEDWSLTVDDEDPDRQTILFTFPNAISDGFAGYVGPVVKIELGARSDHWPVQQAAVSPYLHEVLPDALHEPNFEVRALAAERTFWEKATILHTLYHWPEAKTFPVRMSRHYYDVYMLLASSIGSIAAEDEAMLIRVAEHKAIFFRSASARYEEARRGTLRLSPPDHRQDDLRADFAAMSSMFFDPAPPLDAILAAILAFEKRFNGN